MFINKLQPSDTWTDVPMRTITSAKNTIVFRTDLKIYINASLFSFEAFCMLDIYVS